MLDLLRKNIFIILLACGVIVILIITFQRNDVPEPPRIVTTDNRDQENNNTEEERVILVDIKGEVMTPGVYEMEAGARVKDVVSEAGGFTNDADENFINLAQKVIDEMVIIVPVKGAVENTSSEISGNSKVRINYATVEEIQQLPGIGPSKAKAIVEYRDEHGYFNKAEDLLEVSGIGEKTLEALIEEIQVP